MTGKSNNCQPLFGMRNHPPTFRQSVPLSDVPQMPAELSRALAGQHTSEQQREAAAWLERSRSAIREKLGLVPMEWE